MCGIVGYIGKKKAIDILLNSLKRLEYRGYDSSGIAIYCEDEKKLDIIKKSGKIKDLVQEIERRNPSSSHIGIAHTRWATHGEPNDINAHPHFDCNKKIALVHNGIIENYRTIKSFLLERGHKFKSDTDTEVIVHLIEEFYKGDILESVKKSLKMIEGTYGILVLSSYEPNTIIAARKGSPLIIGKAEDQMIAASDASAIVSLTNQILYMQDGDIARLTKDDVEIFNLETDRITDKEFEQIDITLSQIEKGGYNHFMEKEIFEQPEALQNTFRGRVDIVNGTFRLNGIKDKFRDLLNAERIIITACGTSWHASLIGKYLIEKFTQIPVEVDYASEFRYRNPIITPKTVVILVSQSGETADTLAALRESKNKGATTIGICNVVGSTIARETDCGIYTHVGPEIGVASTKAFTAQVLVFFMLSVALGRKKMLTFEDGINLIKNVEIIPDKINEILNDKDRISKIDKIVEKIYNKTNFLYLGRGINYPVALEGALKLKEISYIHAEGYPAAEMKHGPIALIDENMPALFISLKDSIYEKIINNIKEIKARKGYVIAIANKGDREIEKIVDDVIHIPDTIEELSPLLAVIPLQLIAYKTAVKKGLDVDMPRNLAKSVTVE
ncbi:MAG: Glutamine--fructose-6-phosphate aminotransferase [candidate division TA06 bacterium 32_111]|uniref:Glutamine--fructose-6-phosphate aminotransferase [isomerizing] n=2 Tax=Bacteria candidate phyla TaxID=1783234 RepID=A0A117M6U8_UNCT6|nr:MAG: Glutamine--fructose-6-phosphate aminotransferase [candidate division TA06 bacterium 32_111]KUK87552.1 MAG: Glutamine--fructose-6-phosphate aminotransferase [candidate division TA06 bacterium 34_109]HAF08113.1 glutamine--fructose-6-phosphate transaminase (isomerizing) [candidate division WOR-3 bacterium]HCP16675.1 glutamine--fructose-6-phosphate transaminase (isomerizing) [candidate division WOR-3 bacterium]